MSKLIYQSHIVTKSDDAITFTFGLVEGKNDNPDLVKTVFLEYIDSAILQRLRSGGSIIRLGLSPIQIATINAKIFYNAEAFQIIYTISSSLLRNKLCDKRSESGDVVQIGLLDGRTIECANTTSRGIASVLSLLCWIDILDGYTVTVDTDDYIVRCGNCVFDANRFLCYESFLAEGIRSRLHGNVGCKLGRKEYEINTGKCRLFISRQNYHCGSYRLPNLR